MADDQQARLRLRWSPEVEAACDTKGLVIQRPSGELRLSIPPDFAEALVGLLDGDYSEQQVGEQLVGRFGPAGLGGWRKLSRYLKAQCCLCVELLAPAGLVMRVEILSADFALPESPLVGVQLVEGSIIRREQGAFCVELPRALGRVQRLAPELFAQLLGGGECQSAAVALGWQALIAAGLAERSEPAGAVVRQSSYLEGYEQYFHYRSRSDGHGKPLGGTLPGRRRGLPFPAAHHAPTSGRVALQVPRARDVGEDFLAVTERRRTRYDYADRRLHVDELAALLYWTVRAQREEQTEHGVALVRKPVPSGGAIHEITVYACVRDVDGIEDGLYYYDDQGHAFERVVGSAQCHGKLHDLAHVLTARQARPPVMLLLAADLPRIAWKYESVVYALALKHVGVIYQQLYLVATALGLCPAALGSGSSDLFESATGLDRAVQPLVGEFVVGPGEMRPSDPLGRVAERYEDAVKRRDHATLRELIRAGAVCEVNGYASTDVEFLEHYRDWHAAFSDWEVHVKDVVTVGERVHLHAEVRGKHTGLWLGHEPTGRCFTADSQVWLTVEGEQVAALHESFDTFGMLKQLGLA